MKLNKLIGILVLLMLVGCTSTGLWLDKNIGNNDGKYDGPTITATKTLSDGTTITVGLDEDGNLVTDAAITTATGQVLKLVTDGELSFEHGGIVYEVDVVR